jgi:hypothetical protein
MTRRTRNNKSRRPKADSSMVELLKKIQLNTATNIGQVVPDTVTFPILKRVRPYSVILSYRTFHVNSTTVPTYFSQAISLSALSGYADYTSAFDKYRILEVQCEFIPNNSGVSTTSSAVIDTVIDYDDDTTLTSGSQYEYDSCYSITSAHSFKRTFIPRAAIAAYGGAFTSFAEAKPAQWIDCASPGVQHYALKMAVSPSSPVFSTDMVFRVHVQFANQH